MLRAMKNSNRAVLAVNALVKALVGAVIMGLPLFLSAGTLSYRGAWLLMALLFVPMVIMGVGLLVASPELLARRLNSKEKRSKQSGVVRLSGVMFLAGFVVAGLDARYGWSSLPMAVTVAA